MTTAVRTTDGRIFSSITEAAARLGVDNTTIHYHLNKYGNVDRVGKSIGAQVEFEGVQYPSIRAASRATGKSVDVINRARGYRKPNGSKSAKSESTVGGCRSIAVAMVHKTRGPFVEWMAHEIARRMNADAHSVGVLLSGMCAHGLVHEPAKLPMGGVSWRLTERGAALAATKPEVTFTTRRVQA